MSGERLTPEQSSPTSSLKEKISRLRIVLLALGDVAQRQQRALSWSYCDNFATPFLC